MAQTLPSVRSTDAFSPEAIQTLIKAYDMALTSLQERGQPDVVREVVAKRIIEAAQRGVVGSASLCADALLALHSDRIGR